MTGSTVDLQAMYADYLARRAQLDTAIEGIRAMAALSGIQLVDPEGQQAPPIAPATATGSASHKMAPQQASSGPLAPDTFFGLSTADAVRKYLGIVKRPQSVKNIAVALREGGQIHAIDDDTAAKNVSTAVRRMAARGAAVKTRNGDWGLPEWYRSKAEGE